MCINWFEMGILFGVDFDGKIELYCSIDCNFLKYGWLKIVI